MHITCTRSADAVGVTPSNGDCAHVLLPTLNDRVHARLPWQRRLSRVRVLKLGRLGVGSSAMCGAHGRGVLR